VGEGKGLVVAVGVGLAVGDLVKIGAEAVTLESENRATHSMHEQHSNIKMFIIIKTFFIYVPCVII
jgi:hypothetical protein